MPGAYYIRTATSDDTQTVLTIRAHIEDDLHARGISQWHNTQPHGHAALKAAITRGALYLVISVGTEQAVATIGIDQHDPDFWNEEEAADPTAAYVCKLMIHSAHQGNGLGDALVNWVADVARERGCTRIRLDCNRNNLALQRYWLNRGWRHIETRITPGRDSGAMFERPAHIHTETDVRLIDERKPEDRPERFDRYDPDSSAALWLEASAAVTSLKRSPSADDIDDWNTALEQAARALERRALEIRQGRGGMYHRTMTG